MMSKMREYSKIFIIIVALAFIGLMVFEWGMDYTGLSRRQNAVGSVNGQELTYEMYSDMFQNLYQTERARLNDDLTESQIANLREMVWERFVQQVLFEEEMKRLNITVSDSEIVYQIRNYPLEEIKSNPGFQTNGEFDWDKYYASFSNPQIPWYQIEEYYRQQVLPYQKLQDIISSTIRVSESEIEQEFFNSNVKVEVSYLEIPFAKFADPDYQSSEEEINDYYQDNIDEFQQEESRKLSYVLFPLTPSKQDTARVFLEFDEIRERLTAGEDFNTLAEQFSEDPAVKTNQGRYDFFERGTMVKEFEEAAFNGTVGQLVGPVETQFGYHLIKIEDKRIKDGKEQVKVSHILLKVSPGPSTREKQELASAFFAEDSRSNGFMLTAERQEYSVEQTNFIFKDNQFIPGFGRNFQIYNFAFRSEVGSVSDIIETEKGFAVFHLDEIKEAGPRPLDEVRTVIESRLKTERRKEKARDYAKEIQEQIGQGLSFSQITASHSGGIIRHDSTDSFGMTTSPKGIGLDHIFNATAFSLQQDQISEMIETGRGIYWQKLLEKTEFDSAMYMAQHEMIRQRILTRKRNQAFNNWYNYLKENAEIVDNRKLFNLL